ncbi:MAG: YfiR family protein [Deltaproteobacteria bacterium]|nr:YfiR family protein [Deltaproteobacteria bacterium]
MRNLTPVAIIAFLRSMKPWKNALLVLLFVLVAAANLSDAKCQSHHLSVSLEQTLARAYLYIVFRTRWPVDSINARTGFNFCISQDHSLFQEFSEILPTRKLQDVRVNIITYKTIDELNENTCHLIALGKELEASKLIIDRVSSTSVLTISHEADITPHGGIIQLMFGEKLMPPKINIAAMRQSHLVIDANILAISMRAWK